MLPGCSFPIIWDLEAMKLSLLNIWLSQIFRKHNQGEICCAGMALAQLLPSFKDLQPTAGWGGSSWSLVQSKYLGPVHRVGFLLFFFFSFFFYEKWCILLLMYKKLLVNFCVPLHVFRGAMVVYKLDFFFSKYRIVKYLFLPTLPFSFDFWIICEIKPSQNECFPCL